MTHYHRTGQTDMRPPRRTNKADVKQSSDLRQRKGVRIINFIAMSLIDLITVDMNQGSQCFLQQVL